MPKMKTHRGAAKRFRVSGTGKLRRKKAFNSHKFSSKTQKRLLSLEDVVTVDKADDANMRKVLGLPNKK